MERKKEELVNVTMASAKQSTAPVSVAAECKFLQEFSAILEDKDTFIEYILGV